MVRGCNGGAVMASEAAVPGAVELAISVLLRPLTTHPDERGALTEIYRSAWDTGIDPVQWNCLVSEAQVVRGVHVHIAHTDYVLVVRGRASVGLRDLRPGSPTENRTALIELSADEL